MTSVHHAILCRALLVEEADLPEGVVENEVYDTYHDQFGISEARSLIQQAYHRPIENEVQLIVVRTNFITHEAQNALLKVFEEPPTSTRFVVFVPPEVTLLSTLLSRFELWTIKESGGSSTVFSDFLQLSLKDKLAAIEKAAKAKDINWQRSIKQGLIDYLKCNDLSAEKYQALEYVARNLLTRGSANKMLLEQAALSL